MENNSDSEIQELKDEVSKLRKELENIKTNDEPMTTNEFFRGLLYICLGFIVGILIVKWIKSL